MRTDDLSTIAEAAAALSESDGLRAGCSSIIGKVGQAVHATIAFAAVGRSDSSVADIVAAKGLAAADFRRLEARLTRSTLWQVFRLGRPVAVDDVSKEPSLNHLAFGCGAKFLVAVPIVLKEKTRGLLAVGFPSASRVDEDGVIRFLTVIASLIAQSLRTEKLLSEESRKLAEENLHLKQELRTRYDLSQIVGNSSQMRQVFDQVTQVARSNSTVLLRGEPGTGKELIAHAIHYNSLRSKRPITKVSCATLPAATLEAELFGFEKGGIEGPAAGKRGSIEAADRGTLLIDEIGDLPGPTQLMLLRVLTEQSFRRIGGSEDLSSNVRLLATTTKDLDALAAGGIFDERLLASISPFTIFLPPLRERKADILLLADHFLEKYSRESGKAILRISTPAIDMLAAYHFPGNVRELENAIEWAVKACDSNVIHGHHLPPTLQTAEVSNTVTRLTLTSAVEAFESDLIQDALKSSVGNIARAAKMLDSTERILGYKIKKYGIDPGRFKRWKRRSY